MNLFSRHQNSCNRTFKFVGFVQLNNTGWLLTKQIFYWQQGVTRSRHGSSKLHVVDFMWSWNWFSCDYETGSHWNYLAERCNCYYSAIYIFAQNKITPSKPLCNIMKRSSIYFRFSSWKKCDKQRHYLHL